MLVAPVLDVLVAALALSSRGAEAQTLAAWLEVRVGEVKTCNHCCLRPASVAESECRTDALEVQVSYELERRVVVLTDRNPRNVDATVLDDPGMKLVIIRRTLVR